MVGHDAVFDAYHALSGVMRSWSIQSREDLSERIHRQRFVQPTWKRAFQWEGTGAHFDHSSDHLGVGVSILASGCMRVEKHHLARRLRIWPVSARVNLSLAISLTLVGSLWTMSTCKTYSKRNVPRGRVARRASGEGSVTRVGKFWKSDTKQSLHTTN